MPFRINLGRLQDRIRLEDRIAILTQSHLIFRICPSPGRPRAEDGDSPARSRRSRSPLERFLARLSSSSSSRRAGGAAGGRGRDAAVVLTRFLQDYYQGEGYSVDPVDVRKIYTREGQVCAELDGLLIAEGEKESMLLTVEAKHSLREDDITDRRKKLGKFIDFLANIPDEDDKNASMKFRILCNQLRLCKGLSLEHYIGAVYVPESVKSLAQKKGFNVLQYRGDRYDMAKATGSFVPLKEA
jgi:hypothetical protein